MTFDENINKILHEAYFSSPYEKATGMKSQVNLQEDESEFSELTSRKTDTLTLAAHVAAGIYEESLKETGRVNKKEFANATIEILHKYAQKNTLEGDQFTLKDWGEYFRLIYELSGVKAMSAERLRNILKEAELKIRKELGGGVNQNKDPDVETDPEKLAQARARLASDLDASRKSVTFR